jgi:LacI family transcriptional regulator
MAIPSRGKYLVVAEELESEIAAGKWSVDRRLPGVRQVAERHNVALATAARALEVLIGKGIIESRERSGMYRVAGPPPRAAEVWAMCLRITPGPWQRGSMEVTIRGFVEAAAALGVSMAFDAIPNDLGLPEPTLRKVVRDARQAGVAGLFFIPSRIGEGPMVQDERFLAICRELGLPVVLLDRNLRGERRPLEWDLVCEDDLAGGLACASHLFETGRARLAFVRGGAISSHNERLAGFLLAHYHAIRRGLIPPATPSPLVLEYPEDPSSKRAYRILCDRILEEGVDGVVCYHDRVAIGLAIELLTRGQRVPDDVALTGFDDQAIGQEFALGITTYAYPSRAIADEAIAVMRRRIKDPTAPPIKVVIPSRLIIRESSTAVPADAASHEHRKGLIGV